GEHKGREAGHDARRARAHAGGAPGQLAGWHGGGPRPRRDRRDRGGASQHGVHGQEVHEHKRREEEPHRPEQPEPAAEL
ncbi:MAG: hypothetical protein AVDCRST_MAG05-2776, partial [uncultured Rubrobacteraceae bacterium]